MSLFNRQPKPIPVDRLEKLTQSLQRLQEQRETAALRHGTNRERLMYTIFIDQILTKATGYVEKPAEPKEQ